MLRIIKPQPVGNLADRPALGKVTDEEYHNE
jgi:hypothetical protein